MAFLFFRNLLMFLLLVHSCLSMGFAAPACREAFRVGKEVFCGESLQSEVERFAAARRFDQWVTRHFASEFSIDITSQEREKLKTCQYKNLGLSSFAALEAFYLEFKVNERIHASFGQGRIILLASMVIPIDARASAIRDLAKRKILMVGSESEYQRVLKLLPAFNFSSPSRGVLGPFQEFPHWNILCDFQGFDPKLLIPQPVR